MSTLFTSLKTAKTQAVRTRRSITDLLAPLDQIAVHSPSLLVLRGARFTVQGESYELPRYIFIGAKGGDVPIRIGIFAAIHGDEPEGAHVLVQLVKSLSMNPDLAAGYCISLYPVCNPTGFEDRTRQTRNGRDLDREFWRNSAVSEVRLLESELTKNAFHGIISLHSHSVGDGLYAMARGVTLTKHLIEPALRAAEIFLPRDERAQIEGLPARNGVIRDNSTGVLSAPPNVRPGPFEIILQVPKSSPTYLKEYGIVVALRTILAEYRNLVAYAPNL